VFYWRRRLPGAHGEITLSLGTTAFREAEYMAAVIDGAFPEAVASVSGMSSDSRMTDLNAILRSYLRAALEADRANRMERIAGKPLYANGSMGTVAQAAEADLDAIRAARARAWAALASDAPGDDIAVMADLLLQRHRLPEDQRRPLLVGLMEANLRACEIVERRVMGAEPIIFTEPEPSRVAPPAPLAPAAAPTSLSTKPLFSALAEKGKDGKEAPFFHFRAAVKNTTHQVMAQERSMLRRFRAHSCV